MPRRAVSSRGRGHSQQLSMNETDEAVQVQEETLEHTPQALGGQTNASSSSSVRTRGPNLGHPIPSNPSDRQLIRLKGNVFLDSTVTRSITNDIKMRYTAPWKTWSEIPLKIKDELFGLFRSRYTWDESEEGMVRIAWEKVGKERLRDILNRVRSELLRKHKKTDVAYLYNLGPDWMEAEIWNELVAYWSTPEWRKKSEAGKANRNIEKDGTITKHSGGSIKLEVHENRLAKKLGRQPTQLELFRATHTKKGSQGVYIDGKSRRVDGAYLSAIAENVNDNCESPSAFDLNKWIEISGSSKGRVYGFGSSDIAKSGTPTTSFSCTSAHPGGPSQTMFSLEEVEQILEQNRIKMKQDMEQMQEQMQEQMRVQIEKQIKDQMKSLKNKNISSPHNTTADSDGSTNS
ncbi:uncharacterized protein LOC122722404 [Manihot esculenta]|uniref:uncharacterized protein LOC122722404 n=1 Tax=Manihot esculenta TaxID=3983 RepID=UPI001CC5F409|nr:uncharacterized protein LOC122722404 [Manihot esculenta]